MSNVSIKLLREGAKLPTRGSAFAAGYDLYACLDGDKELIIPPHATAMLPTGLSFALPEGTFGAVVARSGLASKQGLRPANCLGVIDSDYRGECFVALHNDSNEERTVRHGDRVAQLLGQRVNKALGGGIQRVVGDQLAHTHGIGLSLGQDRYGAEQQHCRHQNGNEFLHKTTSLQWFPMIFKRAWPG